MKLKAEEAWATIGEQPLDTFTDSSIFDSSHVLEIVDMTNVFCTESDRIRIAVQKLLVIILDLQLTTIEIDKACSCMQDIDSSNIQFGGEESQFFRRVESFLIQNGIEYQLAFKWDGVTNYALQCPMGYSGDGEKEEEARLEEFGSWLEQEQAELPEEFRLRTE
eukprot:gene6979-5030_t